MYAQNVGSKNKAAAAPQSSGKPGLSPEQARRYHDTGFLAPLPAIGAEHATAVRAKLEAFEARNGPWSKHMTLKLHLLFPWLDEVVRHRAILDTVESIIGPDILCWSSRLFAKSPNDGGYVSWHQDVTYWGLDFSDKILTAWIALSPATRKSGVMKMIPGSHKKVVPHRESASNNLLLRGQEVAVDVDESQARYLELATGEMSLHHALMFHASEENKSNDRRIGFAVRYIPADSRPLPGLPRDSVTLVRGTDRGGHFNLETPPAYDMASEAVAQHKHATETYAEINRQAVAKHEDFLASMK
jgi:non-haem Fe2+, alpha-ketoglutarate-dependent halogenase